MPAACKKFLQFQVTLLPVRFKCDRAAILARTFKEGRTTNRGRFCRCCSIRKTNIQCGVKTSFCLKSKDEQNLPGNLVI